MKRCTVLRDMITNADIVVCKSSSSKKTPTPTLYKERENVIGSAHPPSLLTPHHRFTNSLSLFFTFTNDSLVGQCISVFVW